MIAANELRIGNWVMYDNRLFQIEAISRSLPCLNTDEFGIGVVDWNNINPIPLTPEILEKCGFDRNCILKIYQGVNIEWSYGKEVWLTKEGEVIYEFENTQHLHQLQNLYFALTNEELNYTP